MKPNLQRYSGLVNAIALSSAAALVLYLLRYVMTGSVQFSFMAWNLILSLLALVAGVTFCIFWQQRWRPFSFVLFTIWLFLLPNTFYMLSDFIHVTDSGDITVLFDIVLIGMFAMNGFMHGLISLFIVHKTFLKRYTSSKVWPLMGLIMLASSYAVDMGRFMRWNSWDILLHPTAILFDVSDAILNPFSYDRSFLVTATFFTVISSLYAVIWQAAKVQWNPHGTDKKKHSRRS